MNVFPIPYGTDLHKRVLSAIMARVTLAERAMSDRHEQWRKAEEAAIAYIPETEEDSLRRARRSTGKPEYRTILVPYSYAIMMAAHAYRATVFLGRDPVLQYSALHGAGQHQVNAVEACMAYQVQVGRMMPHLYIWLMDVDLYGLGILESYWDQEIITTSEFTDQIDPMTGEAENVRIYQSFPGYEGNRITNVSPFDFLPDPRVPIHNLDAGGGIGGEFAGRIMRKVGWNQIKRQEAKGNYFNIAQIRKRNEDPDSPSDSGLGHQLVSGDGTSYEGALLDVMGVKDVDIIKMRIELSPKDWGLGSSPYPEIWEFHVVNRSVIIHARPMGSYHGRFGYYTLSGEINGYKLSTRGYMEILDPINEAMTWLLNSHIYAVRSALNNTFLFNPSVINEDDLEAIGPGQNLVRVNPSAYNRPIADAIHQLPVTDITRSHLADMQIFEALAQRVTGVVDNIMGMVNTSGRKTATEVRGSSTFGVNRLKVKAEYESATGMSHLGRILLAETQQRWTQEKLLRVAGDILQAQGANILVGPQDIAGAYDFLPVDGTMPIDRFAQANLLRGIFTEMAKIPPLLAQYDVAGLFSFVGQLMGIKNINRFRIQAGSPEALAQQAQAGNIVPIPGHQSAQPQRDLGRVPDPSRLEGMGATV